MLWNVNVDKHLPSVPAGAAEVPYDETISNKLKVIRLDWFILEIDNSLELMLREVRILNFQVHQFFIEKQFKSFRHPQRTYFEIKNLLHPMTLFFLSASHSTRRYSFLLWNRAFESIICRDWLIAILILLSFYSLRKVISPWLDL